ncbi:MAG: class IV adenylate cyclase [Blastocatellia bacterium]|nr:class IV adenylate cyclase [Blastocatellia bacterium]MCS7156937.1 class IV adenylate cyclase [Blastocatellia bacterium]MCX7752138.1 class IV adenylate cyclase [Blastocatellia bacterium]MDW8167629.1 class IV adenylate cyclase [Acidobacteriota bacterium]MDW8256229.1 class IV adenylate cyclase [Acidobacteriota bacterium]
MGTRDIETEVKVPVEGNPLDGLAEPDVRLVRPRHFEENWVLDFEDGRLQRAGRLLRIRRVADRGTLTFKGPSLAHPRLKVREEIETEVRHPERALAIFERLGLRPIYRYQKYRTEYRVQLPSGAALSVMFDETPIGNFLELEGDEASIWEFLERFRLRKKPLLRASYPTLYAEFCRVQGKPFGDMLFEEENVRCAR